MPPEGKTGSDVSQEPTKLNAKVGTLQLLRALLYLSLKSDIFQYYRVGQKPDCFWNFENFFETPVYVDTE